MGGGGRIPARRSASDLVGDPRPPGTCYFGLGGYPYFLLSFWLKTLQHAFYPVQVWRNKYHRWSKGLAPFNDIDASGSTTTRAARPAGESAGSSRQRASVDGRLASQDGSTQGSTNGEPNILPFKLLGRTFERDYLPLHRDGMSLQELGRRISSDVSHLATRR